ncbi:fibrinogen-like protein 1 [Watersipora subatra]|uniref:fibrinogen-like protein 1 n=1 Tax=Watersipora subatra TaxID=2589382 RepID=UPI00355BD032
MKVLLTAITICSALCYGAVIDFDSPKQKLFVLNQKINTVHQLLDAECPHYVSKLETKDSAKTLLRIEIAEKVFTKLLGELLKCRRESSTGVSKTGAGPVTTEFTTATTELPITKENATTVLGRVLSEDCQEYYEQGFSISGVYEINPPNSTLPPFNIWCDFADGHGWTVIQKRTDATSFYKNWNDYKNGFGDISGHYWLGNDKIHLLTQTNQKLNISLVASDGEERYAAYSLFQVADEADKYRLTISAEGFSGTLKDQLTRTHNGKMFTTWDNDNDLNQGGNCAADSKGGWWYRFCSSADLNESDFSGMYWGDGLWDFQLSVMRVGRD